MGGVPPTMAAGAPKGAAGSGTLGSPPAFLPMTGEVPTWEEVARTHGRFLYNVAYRLAGNDDDAYDLVQEALLRVRKGLETYQPGSMEGWLSRIVTNVFLDEVRRRKRRPLEVLPEDPERLLPAAPPADDPGESLSED